MTILRELVFSLVYYLVAYISVLERRFKDMKHFLKGAAVVVIVLIVLWGINMLCHINGHELDMVPTGTMASVGSILIYHGLTKNEKKKDEQG